MKSLLFTTALLIGVTASAQNDLVELVRSDIRAEAHGIVQANMGLTEENSKVFWPLYDQYAAEVKLVWTKRIEIVREYAEKVATIDDATAKTLMDRALMNDAEKTTLRINWSKKMVKSLPATVVARFFQIDSQLDHLISAQIADEVPLMPAAK